MFDPRGIFYMNKIAVGPSARGAIIQCKLWPRNDLERKQGLANDIDFDRVLTADDLVNGTDIFFAAIGITDGELLHGVRYTGDGAKTYSLALRARSGTVRIVEATHKFDKLGSISGV